LTQFSWKKAKARRLLQVKKQILDMQKAGKGKQVIMLKAQQLKLEKKIADG